MKHCILLTAALLLASCATYRPDPVDDASAMMSPPVLAVLSTDAATLRRPFLTPASIDLSQPLDMNAIATLAVLGNPDLRAQRVRASVNDAQIFAAGLLPDPTFSTGIDHLVSGPDPVDAIATALGLDLNSLRTRGVVRQRARAEARQVRLDLAWTEWQTSGQARIQAVRIIGLERTLALARASHAAAESLLARSLRAAGRGDLAADQVQSARLSASDAFARSRTAERDLSAARLDLAKLLGLPPDFPLRLASYASPAPVPSPTTLFAIAEANRADLKALQAGYAAQEAAVHKAVLDQFPNLTLTINAQRDSSRNLLIGPAIDVALPLWNRNRGGIAVERATRAALKAEYEARLFQTRAEIAAAAAALTISRAQRDAILHDLPPLRRFAEASRRAADRGDLSLATAETAEQALRDKEAAVAQLEQDAGEQTIALELLTGTPQEAWNR